MKTNTLIALMCALSFTAVSCSKDNKKEETTSAPEIIVEEQKVETPEGLFKDDPVVMTSSYEGKSLRLNFDGDVTSEGKIILSGDDAQALFISMDIKPESKVEDVARINTKQGQMFGCVEYIHSTQGTTYSCEMNFDYANGKAKRVWRDNLFSTWNFDDFGKAPTGFKGDVLTLNAPHNGKNLGMVNLTGDDARALYSALVIKEKTIIPAGNIQVKEKSSKDLTCWKTPVGDLVSFNCRVVVDWGWGQTAPSSMAQAAE